MSRYGSRGVIPISHNGRCPPISGVHLTNWAHHPWVGWYLLTLTSPPLAVKLFFLLPTFALLPPSETTSIVLPLFVSSLLLLSVISQ